MNEHQQIVDLIEDARCNPDDCNSEGLAQVIEDILKVKRPDREKIHKITNLLAKRVVGEASKKNFSGLAVTQFNEQADNEIIALFDNTELYEACLTALGVMTTLDQSKGWVKEISGVIQKALANKPKGKVLTGKASEVFDEFAAITRARPDLKVRVWIEEGGNNDKTS